MLTLNQDIELFKNFALKHKGINSFYFGDESEADTNVEIVYPFMNVILQGSSIAEGVVSRKYMIVISDLVNKDISNVNQVLSDVERLCYDVPNYLRQVRNSGYLGAFKFDANISLTDFTERNDDDVSGHFFDLTISSAIGNDSCVLPINSGNILDNNYIYVGGTINQIVGNFQVLIQDQSGNTLQTFTTSGTYTVEVLQQIIDTINSNTATIIDPIV
jgi:hypothetical protein